MHVTALLLIAFVSLPWKISCFEVARDYSGQTFFQGWDFYGNVDNLTFGNVNYLTYDNATAQKLAYINDAGNAIMKVDNFTTVTAGGNRNSIRMTSQDWYSFGSLWVIDVVHIPFGCSVWPAFWSTGTDWPVNGEIDIIENVNVRTSNNYALHTTQGCTHTTPPDQEGKTNFQSCSPGSGCTVSELKPNSYGAGFAQAGGGVFATQFDLSGIYMWFWNRTAMPASLLNSTSTSALDISDWGDPSAAFTNTTCTMANYFGEQQLVFDITLCGDWAGVGSTYNATCGKSGSSGLCYENNVVGNGSNYNDAYFEVSYLRAYTTSAASSTTSSSTSPTSPTTFSPSSTHRNTRTELLEVALWATVSCVVLGAFGVTLSVI